MTNYENMRAGDLQGACYEIEKAILWARSLTAQEFNDIQQQEYGIRGFVKETLMNEHNPENNIVHTGEYNGLFD